MQCILYYVKICRILKVKQLKVELMKTLLNSTIFDCLVKVKLSNRNERQWI